MNQNKWKKFARNFEERNEYVVGKLDILEVKSNLESLTDIGKMLELGCGNGTYTKCFLKSATSIIATDISKEMVLATKDRLKANNKVIVEVADSLALPYKDSSFDTIFMANLLHVIPKPETALAESYRVLRPGGKLIAISFTVHGMSFINKLLLKYRYVKTYGKKSSSNTKMTPELAKQLLSSAKFKSIATKLLGLKVKAVLMIAVKK